MTIGKTSPADASTTLATELHTVMKALNVFPLLLFALACLPLLVNASDSDGDSQFPGAFLVLAAETMNGHPGFRSFDVASTVSEAFASTCEKRGPVWINNQKTSCIAYRTSRHGKAIEIEVSALPEKGNASCLVVSTLPAPSVALRALTNHEQEALKTSAAASQQKPGTFSMTTVAQRSAKASSVNGRTFVFVPVSRRPDKSRPTHAFAIDNGQVIFLGKLEDWPEKVIDIGETGKPQVIINKPGDAFVIKVMSLWPKVAPEMFVSEGG